MAFTHTLGTNWNGGGLSLAASNTYSAGAELNITESIADSATDAEVAATIDVSEIKSIYILSDQALTLETNNGAAPADTIVLVANEPYIWYTGSYYTNLLATDITALFFTNASGSVATIELRCVFDPTP